MQNERRKNHRLKVIATDTLGGLLILLSALVGWLPGPAGLPLFFAGFSLLALNHDWAKRWLETSKEKGFSFTAKIFTGSPKRQRLIDALCLLGLTAAFAIIVIAEGYIIQYMAVILAIFSFTTFMMNRNRVLKLKRIIRR